MMINDGVTADSCSIASHFFDEINGSFASEAPLFKLKSIFLNAFV